MTPHDAQSRTDVAGRDERYADRPYDRQKDRVVDPGTDARWRGSYGSDAPSAGREAALTASSIASALVFLAGVWLVLAPRALDYNALGTDFDGYWNDVVIGVAVGLAALVRAATPARSAAFGLANLGLGGWLIAAPWVLNYNDAIDAPRATWNDIIVGIIVAALALISMGSGLFGRSSGRSASRIE